MVRGNSRRNGDMAAGTRPGVATDPHPRRYELHNDGDWQPAALVERSDRRDRTGEQPLADGRREVLLSVDEFNIRQVEAACGRGELELRDDRGGRWTFRPRRITFDYAAFAEGELRPTDDVEGNR
jgi:hypothetical protein